tara:strand:+ start:643 stop:1572 length:930 start_codon:yes stop_codon:yes gene_type:complete
VRLSILVISRTAGLVNRLCAGLNEASSLPANQAEILCSWNGSEQDEQLLNNTSRFDFHVAQRDPYHFAGNMNSLASKATGDVLMLANDDLLLDPGCVDEGMAVLSRNSKVGLVGARLRDQKGKLTHAGIQFDSKYSSYHPLDQLIEASDTTLSPGGPVAAVTGALQWIRRQDFINQPYNTNYQVCGEDVELCLDVQEHLHQQVWLCNTATAIHESETTRSQQPDQGMNSVDLLRLRARTQSFIERATTDQLRVFLKQQQRESQQLRDLIREDLMDRQILESEQERILMDMREERLRLKQELEILKGGLQ